MLRTWVLAKLIGCPRRPLGFQVGPPLRLGSPQVVGLLGCYYTTTSQHTHHTHRGGPQWQVPCPSPMSDPMAVHGSKFARNGSSQHSATALNGHVNGFQPAMLSSFTHGQRPKGRTLNLGKGQFRRPKRPASFPESQSSVLSAVSLQGACRAHLPIPAPAPGLERGPRRPRGARLGPSPECCPKDTKGEVAQSRNCDRCLERKELQLGSSSAILTGQEQFRS